MNMERTQVVGRKYGNGTLINTVYKKCVFINSKDEEHLFNGLYRVKEARKNI